MTYDPMESWKQYQPATPQVSAPNAVFVQSDPYIDHTVSIIRAMMPMLTLTEIPGAIQLVYNALRGAYANMAASAVPEVPPAPAVDKPTKAEIAKSITPDHLVSFEDGKSYKMLKRHVGKLGMTLEQYRAKWGLPADYPSVAASYSARRSELAKENGLGLGQR